MKALAIRRYKAPMEMMELPRPEPGPGDLLVRVRAASVNPVDHKICDGGVKVLVPYSFPLILGNDVALEPRDARADCLVRESAAARKPARLDYGCGVQWKGPVQDGLDDPLIHERRDLLQLLPARVHEEVLEARALLLRQAIDEAVSYVEAGRAVGKAVIAVAD
jgi:hypothetical protein